MTYDEALAFWYGRINYEVRSARPADLKLERMCQFLHGIGDPHHRLRIVHITGTKGKGSTAALLAATLRAAGYRVGLFTSPHLERVEERIRVDGVCIHEQELVALMAELAPVVRGFETAGRDGPTFFEIGTALGFLHFVRRRVDVAVVEVGLGGRFDSTNVCTPLVSVVTSIGMDHVAQLGDTPEKIAYQKAGIIKPGRPVVCGVRETAPREVIHAVAAEMGSPVRQVGVDFDYVYTPPNTITPRTRRSYPPMTLRLLGEHQAANGAVVVAVVEELRRVGLSIPDQAIVDGFRRVEWPARVEIVRTNPTIVLDTAHNEPSVDALVRTLAEAFPQARRKVCVFAVSSDKPYPQMLRRLAEYFDEFVLTRYSDNPRRVSPDKLLGLVGGRPVRVVEPAVAAWRVAVTDRQVADLVCVTGSVFLAGELRSLVMGESTPA